MKSILNINKTEKKNKNKNFDEIKELEIELRKIKFANNPDNLRFEIKLFNEIHVVNKNLHEIKQELIMDYTGEFEMVGRLNFGDQIRQTHVKFWNITDYEAYKNSIDEGYDAEDSIFNGYLFIKDTPHFNYVNRSQYANGCDFKHEIIEY